MVPAPKPAAAGTLSLGQGGANRLIGESAAPGANMMCTRAAWKTQSCPPAPNLPRLRPIAPPPPPQTNPTPCRVGRHGWRAPLGLDASCFTPRWRRRAVREPDRPLAVSFAESKRHRPAVYREGPSTTADLKVLVWEKLLDYWAGGEAERKPGSPTRENAAVSQLG